MISERSSPRYRGATFMAASQFNCLEFANPDVVPEDGVQNYIYDATQVSRGSSVVRELHPGAILHLHLQWRRGRRARSPRPRRRWCGTTISLCMMARARAKWVRALSGS